MTNETILAASVINLGESRKSYADSSRSAFAYDERDKYRFVGEGKAYDALMTRVEQVAQANCDCLISGETGTGKELVARKIHGLSNRNKYPIVVVNANVERDILAQAIFGISDKSYTGVGSRQGYLTETGKGILVLTDIAELPLESQSSLLGIFDCEKENRRVGRSGVTTRFEGRLILVSNKDLRTQVAENKFLPDLYYRVRRAEITVPPLREREDIVVLADYLIDKAAKRNGRSTVSLTDEQKARIKKLPWPGNVRELDACMEELVLFGEFPPTMGMGFTEEPSETSSVDEYLMSTSQVKIEKRKAMLALQEAGGAISAAARLYGCSHESFRYKIRNYGLDPKDFMK